MKELHLTLTEKQHRFVSADTLEVLFGGAAGGGKSYGQVADALLFALRYPRSRQLMLRRSFAELDKSLIRTALSLFPRSLFSFHSSTHVGRFVNGSVIDFGYCATETDVYQYQSAEYDVIRFDELTHFTEGQYVYLLSRVRGTNGYPKQIKSTTNPGGIGHAWVKARFIDPAPQGEVFEVGTASRLYIPARIDDNRFLTEADPAYRERLELLPERERRALLHGDWNIFEGQYFSEFSERVHVISPFSLPAAWRRFRTLDYGLDCLACLWIALAPTGEVYVYRELAVPDLPIGRAAEAILSLTPKDESIYATLAPPDLFARSQESGRSKALLFAECGLPLVRSGADRETGWLCVKELLDARGRPPRLRIFSTCRRLVRDLPSLTVDPLRPSDCRTEPHEITHVPDALRGFAIYYARPSAEPTGARRRSWSPDLLEDLAAASEDERQYLIQKYGEPL